MAHRNFLLSIKRVYSTIDIEEIRKFKKLGSKWTSNNQEFQLLRLLNPLRVKYVTQHFAKNLQSSTILDVGTGAGLFALPLARMGARVIGIDACIESINAAKLLHSDYIKRESLKLEFRECSIENLNEQELFDIILVSEVVEHVCNPEEFLHYCFNKLKPDGLMFISTINKSILSKLLVVEVAEKLLRIVPRGTHDPRKFFSIEQLESFVKSVGPDCELVDVQGVAYIPILGEWKYIPTSLVNYFAIVVRKEQQENKPGSAPGQALTDALDELIQNQQITPQLAMRVLFQFDRVMTESLNSMVRGRCTIKGHLSNYRYLDDVWTFIVKNAEVRFDDDTQMSKHLKIVACNARRPENAPK